MALLSMARQGGRLATRWMPPLRGSRPMLARVAGSMAWTAPAAHAAFTTAAPRAGRAPSSPYPEVADTVAQPDGRRAKPPASRSRGPATPYPEVDDTIAQPPRSRSRSRSNANARAGSRSRTATPKSGTAPTSSDAAKASPEAAPEVADTVAQPRSEQPGSPSAAAPKHGTASPYPEVADTVAQPATTQRATHGAAKSPTGSETVNAVAAAGAAKPRRLSGLQRDVLELYRRFHRALGGGRRAGPADASAASLIPYIRSKFRADAASVGPRDFVAIEAMLRRGRKQLETLTQTSISGFQVTQPGRGNAGHGHA
ncbi:hypothetical protein CXG81DRAFT_23860 [Caulochytrium protostelioides]|uniref:Uncharacterized protein n=1 Tax=Caulochytrium protostelioides TaxID=1555241 RepID=A0A4P9XDD3_9FUNG|nr:hypothetical protein CXG81DRAFT_23860 [Caulochytrium protostelioides]|eukprot:RKP03463.1 hypothetical protein CXG81DRAFT_23860 [Caulochytrium protostelioides]